MKRLFALWSLVTLFSLSAHAAEWYVDISNTGPADGTTIDTAFPAIQTAIDAANPGDTIYVLAGEYHGSVLVNKDVHLRSFDDPNAPMLDNAPAVQPLFGQIPVINGDGAPAVVSFDPSVTPACIFEGFTVTNGDVGLKGNGSSPTLKANWAQKNATYGVQGFGPFGGAGGIRVTETRQGPGLFQVDCPIEDSLIERNLGGGLEDCDGEIRGCIIRYNAATFGNGGGLNNCSGPITNCQIYGNSAYVSGGGLYNCGGTIANSIIVLNNATFGGGIYGGAGALWNNTIADNHASNGGGLHSFTGIIRNSIIFHNEAANNPQMAASSVPDYSCIQGWAGGGTGNISDPPFVAFTKDQRAFYWYHLFPASPCIDAGQTAPTVPDDIDGTARPIDQSPLPRGDGSNYDIGADEHPGGGDGDGDGIADADEGGGAVDTDNDTVPDDEDDDSDNDGTPDADEGWGDSDGDGDPDFRDPDLPPVARPLFIVPTDYSTIQLAIDAATAGDVIEVLPGTFFENLNFKNKNITVRSTDPLDSAVVANTVINAGGGATGVLFAGAEWAAVFEGFTVTNGYYAFYGSVSSEPHIFHNRITGNQIGIGACAGLMQSNDIIDNAQYGFYACDGVMDSNEVSGHQIGVYYCDGAIQNNVISGNDNGSQDGGGISMCSGPITGNTICGNMADSGAGIDECSGPITNNTICDNTAGYLGGGINECTGEITDNSICGNTAQYGGGIYGCSGTIAGNEICTNDANSGGGIYYCSGDISGNSIHHNEASNVGGGIYYATGAVVNNFLYANSAGYTGGGASYVLGPFLHNTLYGNTAVAAGGGVDSASSTNDFNIVWGNTANLFPQVYGSTDPNYSCIDGWTDGGTGNITSDPMFYDPANGDYHLDLSSACIDSAGPSLISIDADGEARPAGAAPDIGADEGVDQDGDLLPDAWERRVGLDPNELDHYEDNDGDGLNNLQEYDAGTDPFNADSDGDGFKDGYEVDSGRDPRDPTNAPSEVWLDVDYTGFETGTQLQPFDTLPEAVDAITPLLDTLVALSGGSPDPIRVTKPLRLIAVGGTFRVGAN